MSDELKERSIIGNVPTPKANLDHLKSNMNFRHRWSANNEISQSSKVEIVKAKEAQIKNEAEIYIHHSNMIKDQAIAAITLSSTQALYSMMHHLNEAKSAHDTAITKQTTAVVVHQAMLEQTNLQHLEQLVNAGKINSDNRELIESIIKNNTQSDMIAANNRSHVIKEATTNICTHALSVGKRFTG